MRKLAFACSLMAVVGLISGVAAEPRVVLIEEFTNTS
jgi:hypothetical protein